MIYEEIEGAPKVLDKMPDRMTAKTSHAHLHYPCALNSKSITHLFLKIQCKKTHHLLLYIKLSRSEDNKVLVGIIISHASENLNYLIEFTYNLN